MDICEFLKGETIISDGSVSSKSTTDFVGQRGRKYKKGQQQFGIMNE